MASFRETRNTLLYFYADNLIDDEEFALLYNINKSKNLDFEYWTYDGFDLDCISDDDCIAEFRFQKNDIKRLKDVLQLPNQLTCDLYNNLKIDSLEALCILLKRLAYPCRYSDMIPRFGRSVPQLCMVFNQTLDYVDRHFGHLVQNLNQPWLAANFLTDFSNAIYAKGAALDNVWGFIDGTVRGISRPSVNQRLVYNGHKRKHALKYQSITTPNGMIANLFGPVEGRRHDSSMLTMSGLMPILENFCVGVNGERLCIYGDPAYPLRWFLQAPFRGARITRQQTEFNKTMSKVRVTVEWLFGELIENFKFTDFKKNQKLGLSCLGKMYKVSGLLTNAHTCFYKNNCCNFFGLEPPIIEDYFQFE